MSETIPADTSPLVQRLKDENAMLKAGFTEICDRLERGEIGEDVVWFDNWTTLWEFCSQFIGRDEPLGEELQEPTPADREYLAYRLIALLSQHDTSLTARNQVVRDVLSCIDQAEKSACELSTPTPIKGRYRTVGGHAV